MPALRGLSQQIEVVCIDDSFSLGRCHLRIELGPPWRAHVSKDKIHPILQKGELFVLTVTQGYGAGRPRSLQQVHELQPQEPEVAKP